MKGNQFVAGFIGCMVVLAVCAFAIYIGVKPLPEANQHFIDITLGALLGQFANVIGYYYGSSRSAENAQATVAAATPAAQPNAAEVTAEAAKKS